MHEKSVLIVDDDKDIRENLAYALESEGHNTFQVENGQKALEFLQTREVKDLPCCILLDVMMPVMDGKTFLTILSDSKNEFAKVPVIIITALGSGDQVSLPIRVEKMSKPIDLDQLLMSIERHCL